MKCQCGSDVQTKFCGECGARVDDPLAQCVMYLRKRADEERRKKAIWQDRWDKESEKTDIERDVYWPRVNRHAEAAGRFDSWANAIEAIPMPYRALGTDPDKDEPHDIPGARYLSDVCAACGHSWNFHLRSVASVNGRDDACTAEGCSCGNFHRKAPT